MLPFPILNYYGNNIVPPVKTIKNFSVAANGTSTLIHYDNGDLYAFGTNTAGKFGQGNTDAISGAWLKIHNASVRLYTCSHSTTIVILNDGTVMYSGNVALVFTNALGYSFSAATSWTDMTSAFSSFDIPGIKKIVLFEDSGTRCWVIDKNDQLWCIGSNQYYALGANSSTATTNWTAAVNGTNVADVMPCLQGVWVKKTDGTYWRAGTNAYGTLMATISSTISTLTVQNSFTASTLATTLVELTTNQYNTYARLGDGSVRLYGISSSGQLGNGSTTGGTFANPSNPSLTGVQGLQSPGGYIYSNMIKGSTGLLSTGDNGNGRLGTGAATSPTSFTSSNTGAITNIDLGDINYMTYTSLAGYMVTNTEVYTAGALGGTLLPASGVYTWTLMNTPQSSLYNINDYVSTITNASSTVPNMTRYNHSRCSYGDSKFIIYGGYTGTAVLNDINIYDTTTGTWSTVPVTANTQARYGAGITTVGDTMYVFCGNDTSTTTTNTVYSVDLITGVWTTLSTVGTPTARSSVRACTIGSMVYIWGAVTGTTWYSFNTSTNTFVSLPVSPLGGNLNCDMCTDGTDIYITNNTAVFYKYQFKTNTWVLLAPKVNSSTGRIEYSNGYIYNATNGSTSIQAYSIAKNTWTTLPNVGLISTDRQCISAAGGTVFSTGGAASTSTNNCFTIT